MKKWNQNFYSTSISGIVDFFNEIYREELVEGKISDTIYSDSLVLVKVCDKKTTNHLYGIPINPVYITILCPTGAKFIQDDKGKYLHNMKIQVHSIDDSSYGIWFYDLPLNTLRYIREELFKYLKSEYLLSGDDLLFKAIEYGADPDSIDYN